MSTPVKSKRTLILLVLVQLLGLGAVAAVYLAPREQQAPPVPEGWPVLQGPLVVEIPSMELETGRLDAETLSRQCQGRALRVKTPTRQRVIKSEEVGLLVISKDEITKRDEAIAKGMRFKAKGDLLIGLDPLATERLLRGLADAIAVEPIRAQWDFKEDRLLPGIQGRQLDLRTSQARVLSGICEEDEIELPLKDLPPAFNDPNFKPVARLSIFKTSYNARKKARSHNLNLAAQALHGIILGPSERLSYNEVVGERTEGRGFRDAPVIVQGEIVEGIGGGACQVSSTIHAAALFAGMEILERHNHSLPSSYIGKGLDAMVAWPDVDLEIKNPYPFPVALRSEVRDGKVIASLHGPSPGHRVVMRREVSNLIPFKEIVTVEPTLMPGDIKIRRRGTVGYRVLRARSIWEGGEERFERLPLDIYQPRAQKVSVGPETPYPPIEEEEMGDPGEIPPP